MTEFSRILLASGILQQACTVLQESQEIYLVGGAVRDALLGKPSHDLDFVLPGDPRPVARRIANMLGGAYYLMDEVRLTARVVLGGNEKDPTFLDFARCRGEDLTADLTGRDFTINAIALPASDLERLIDPLGGEDDVHRHLIRACSPTSFIDDPVRILRGFRLQLTLGFSILPETLAWMEQSTFRLAEVSIERRRDELFQILESAQPAEGIDQLDQVGALQHVLPELLSLRGVQQSPPHIRDVWEHSLDTARTLTEILDRISTGRAKS